MNEDVKETMETYLTEEEIKLLERVAEALGENIETIFYNWSKNKTIEALVEALEKAW